MNIVLPFIQNEYHQALEWLKWVNDFCGYQQNHSLYLLPFKGIDPTNAIAAGTAAFGSVEVIQDSQGVRSDWKAEENWRDARGPNSLFRQAAWHFYYLKKGPWFFCEPDCIVIKKDAFDLAEHEYRSCGKPFMGTIVRMASEQIYQRLNGVAIYPENTPVVGSSLLQMKEFPNGMEAAFDICGANEVVPKSHYSTLFRHYQFGETGHKPPTFPEDKILIGEKTAFFHRCKDGSLYKMLLGNNGGADVNGAEVKDPQTGFSSPEAESGGVDVPQERHVEPSYAKKLEEYDRTFTEANPDGGVRRTPKAKPKRKRRKFSKEALANIRAGALKRWAKKRSVSSEETGM